MKTLTTVTLGDREYELPEMNFAALEMAWPFIEEALLSASPVTYPSAAVSILVCLWMEDEEGFDIMAPMWEPVREKHKVDADSTYRHQFDSMVMFFKRSVKAAQVPQLREAIDLLLKDAQIIQDKEPGSGEAQGAAPLTETSTTSSPSSLPQDAKEEAGTA